MLPGPGGGFMRGSRNTYTNNQSQLPPQGAGYNQYPQQQRQDGLGIYNGGSGPQQAPVDLPPPPYPGKEADPGQMVPPGVYAPPPGPPPPAHVNDNNTVRRCFLLYLRQSFTCTFRSSDVLVGSIEPTKRTANKQFAIFW